MGLKLRIISYQRHSLTQTEFVVAEGGRASIGRGSGNDWALPDPERLLSNRHCTIEQRDGGYYVTDTSTNGVYLNKSPQRIGRNERRLLSDGDHLQLGEFEIEVALDLSAAARMAQTEPALPAADSSKSEPPAEELLEKLDLGDREREPAAESPPQLPAGSATASEEGTEAPIRSAPLAPRPDDTFIDREWSSEQAEEEADTNSQQVPPGSDPASQVTGQDPSNPQVIRSRTPHSLISAERAAVVGESPAAVDQTPQPAPTAPAPPPAAPSAAAAAVPAVATGDLDEALRCFLRGAGLSKLGPGQQPPDEVLERAGQLFRVMVQGLMELLMSRSSVKGGFRIQQTTLQPADNNPLKFSLSVEDAMRALLSDGGTPNLSGEQALSQVVRDIKIHQVAMVAGMQAALHHLLERFDPAALEARLGDASFVECVVPGARKVRNWDFYARFYGEMLREAEDDFQDLFARQFARAYEEQISKL